MTRSAASFRRKEARYKPQPTVLVICEDKKSGKQYLDEAAYHFRVKVAVEISHCGNTDPRGIINEAIRRLAYFDKVYCVIDRDDHETFDEALAKARQHEGVELIPSYPCFEFWILLHFGYSRKPFSSIGNASAGDRLISELRTRIGMEKYSKGAVQGLFNSLLGERFEMARSLAPRVLDEANRSGEMNPSTALHELINAFEALSKPQLK